MTNFITEPRTQIDTYVILELKRCRCGHFMPAIIIFMATWKFRIRRPHTQYMHCHTIHKRQISKSHNVQHISLEMFHTRSLVTGVGHTIWIFRWNPFDVAHVENPFQFYFFALLISNLIYATEHKTFCLLYFHILPQVCQIIVWHTARVAGTAFHARMEFGAAKTSYYGARWQSEFWATAQAEEGELHFNKVLRAYVWRVQCVCLRLNTGCPHQVHL